MACVAQGFDAGDEFIPIVMLGQLRGDISNERMPCGIELRPFAGDRLQRRRAIHGSIIAYEAVSKLVMAAFSAVCGRFLSGAWNDLNEGAHECVDSRCMSSTSKVTRRVGRLISTILSISSDTAS